MLLTRVVHQKMEEAYNQGAKDMLAVLARRPSFYAEDVPWADTARMRETLYKQTLAKL